MTESGSVVSWGWGGQRIGLADKDVKVFGGGVMEIFCIIFVMLVMRYTFTTVHLYA